MIFQGIINTNIFSNRGIKYGFDYFKWRRYEYSFPAAGPGILNLYEFVSINVTRRCDM